MELEKATNDIEEFSLNGQKLLCKVVDIYDADTCKVVFIFNNKLTKFNCRLMGIDTPEMKPPKSQENRELEKIAAKKARNRLIQLSTNVDCEIDKMYKKNEIKNMLLDNTKLVEISCGEFDKYGRLLGTLQNSGEQITFNQILIDENYAKSYFGKTKEAFTFTKGL